MLSDGAHAQMDRGDEIEYRGVKIKLSHEYSDYDAYKNDVDKILPSELPKLEKMIVDAPVGTEFSDWKSFASVLFSLKVPGFGLGNGPKVISTDTEVIVKRVEIPTRHAAEKFRYFVLEMRKNGSLRVIDDFVFDGYPHLTGAAVANGHIVYSSKDGTVVRAVKF